MDKVRVKVQIGKVDWPGPKAKAQMAECFNLNFSNPGGTAPFQSLLLSPKQECSSDEAAAGDSDGSKASTPAAGMSSTPDSQRPAMNLLPNGKKTKGRVKIKMEYIGNKLRRYTTFSKRKTGIMKKAQELSTLTGTQVMLLVASETGHVYAYATDKLKPVIQEGPGRALVEGCLRAPDRAPQEADSLKTEFTFEAASGSLTNANPRKRKIQSDFTETLSIPTMVASASPMESYAESDNESVDESADKDEDEVEDKGQILKDIMRAASEHRRSGKKKERKPENVLASLLANCDQVNFNNFLPLLLSGLSASPTSSANSPPRDNNNKDKVVVDAMIPGTSTRTAPDGQVIFHMPQGCVYSSPDGGLDTHSSATASPPTTNPTDADALQQLLGIQLGQNMLQNLLQGFSDANGKT